MATAATTVYSPRPSIRFNSHSIHLQVVTSSFIPQFFNSSSPNFKRSLKLPSSRARFLKSLTSTCSISEETASNSATEVAVIAPSLELKKKAMDISPVLRGTSIFLVGMKSSIKSNLGKLLADVLQYYYFDSDSLVEEAAGGPSAAKTYRENDEMGFRASETEVLKQLSSMGRLVVCTGDGAVQSSTNLALLRHGISLWIDVPLEIVAKESISSGESSVSTSESYSEVVGRVASRYESLKDGLSTADATISLLKVASKLGHEDANAVTSEGLTLEVLEEMEKLTRVKKMMEEAARPF